LAAGEPLHYLLYSPIFDGGDGPFHVGGAPGSHAVAITPQRLLVSRDPHSDPEPRSVHSIDLESISSMEIGCALALGWFVVRFSRPPGAVPVLFAARGLRHFRAIVRAYRRPGRGRPPAESGLDWPRVWEGVPAYLRAELEPLTEEAEQPLALLRSPLHWSAEGPLRGRWPVCVSAPGLLVATPLGLLWATSEPPIDRHVLAFGVNVTAVRAERVMDAVIGHRATHGTTIPVLRVRAGDRRAVLSLEVPFDSEDTPSAEEIVRLASAWRGQP
jgi:hypothetical protein